MPCRLFLVTPNVAHCQVGEANEDHDRTECLGLYEAFQSHDWEVDIVMNTSEARLGGKREHL